MRLSAPPSKLTKNEEGCLSAAVTAIFLPFIVVLDGWALSVMWGWFVIGPTGWAPIGLWEAAGLMAIKPIISWRYSAADQIVERDEGVLKMTVTKAIGSVFVTLISLGLGGVIHLLAT